jgi:hypothetical protein
VRALPLLIAVLAVLAASPASAKGPAMTWHVDPETATVGEPARITVRTWEWTRKGERGTRRPWPFFHEESLRLQVRVYPSVRFPEIGPAGGIGIGPLVRVSPSAYQGTITFPRPGQWALAWRGYHPGAPDRADRLIRNIRVLDRQPLWRDGTPSPRGLLAVGAGGFAFAVGLAVRARRKSDSKSG